MDIAIHSSVLSWRIPGTVEPGGLPSLGLHRVAHDWSDLIAAAANFVLYSVWIKWLWKQIFSVLRKNIICENNVFGR